MLIRSSWVTIPVKLVLSIIIASTLIGVSLFISQHQDASGKQLKILESQLNKHSITGILQNPYNHSVSGIVVQAEFYDKEGNLIGVRDVGHSTKEELQSGEKSPYKIPDIGKAFPKTRFIVTADGIDSTNLKETTFENVISNIESLGRSLKNLPDEVVINVIKNENVSNQIVSNQSINP